MARLALVTGTSTGIGRAVAIRLARHGFEVLAGVRRPEDAPPGLEPIVLDVTSEHDVAAAAGRIGRNLHALVNNAGIAVNGPVEVVPVEQWRRQFEVNLIGQVAVTRAVLPALVNARGRIVNISSISGRVAWPLLGPYTASKFALEAVTDVLRREVGPHGVHVVSVEPGGIATPVWDKSRADAQRMLSAMPADARRRYGHRMLTRLWICTTLSGSARPLLLLRGAEECISLTTSTVEIHASPHTSSVEHPAGFDAPVALIGREAMVRSMRVAALLGFRRDDRRGGRRGVLGGRSGGSRVSNAWQGRVLQRLQRRSIRWTPNDGFTVDMTTQGRPHKSYRKDHRGYVDDSAPVLRFGRTKRVGRYICKSRSNGLTCTNRRGTDGGSDATSATACSSRVAYVHDRSTLSCRSKRASSAPVA